MSKSRGNFLDPHAVVAAFGADGARYVDPARGRLRPRHRVSLGLVRAALQRGPRQRLRQPRQPHRLDGQPLPRRRAARAAPGRRVAARRGLGRHARGVPRSGSRRCLLHDALAELWEFVGGANKTVDAEQPWTLNKAAKAGDEAAAARLRGVLGDLVEACRLVGLAVAPFMPASGAPDPRAARPRLPVRRRRQRRPAASSSALAWGASPPGRPRDRRARHRCSRARDRGRSSPRRPDHAVRLVDSHGHVNADRFDDDVDLVLGGARLAGVERLLVPGLERRARRRAPWARRAAGRGSTPRSASTPTTPPRSTPPAGPRSRPGRATSGSSRSARPGSTPTGCSRRAASSTTCAATSRSRSRRASRRSCTAGRRPGERDAPGRARRRAARGRVRRRGAPRRSGSGRRP